MVRSQVTDPFFPECPIRNILARVGDKWSILVLSTLDGSSEPMRYRDVHKKITDISQKMLSVTLRDLEADGLVRRIAYAEVPPRVEYSLTDRGKSLMPHIHHLIEWALDNLSGIIKDRKEYSQRHSYTPHHE